MFGLVGDARAMLRRSCATRSGSTASSSRRGSPAGTGCSSATARSPTARSSRRVACLPDGRPARCRRRVLGRLPARDARGGPPPGPRDGGRGRGAQAVDPRRFRDSGPRGGRSPAQRRRLQDATMTVPAARSRPRHPVHARRRRGRLDLLDAHLAWLDEQGIGASRRSGPMGRARRCRWRAAGRDRAHRRPSERDRSSPARDATRCRRRSSSRFAVEHGATGLLVAPPWYSGSSATAWRATRRAAVRAARRSAGPYNVPPTRASRSTRGHSGAARALR